ncbi:MAG: hypothetical protein QG594_209 [Bacteroidota bacterium]|nr:hypothetical protein [Bacteroidota bacterium]
MKGKFLFLSLVVLLTTIGAKAQPAEESRSIISTTASIKNFYSLADLKQKKKGELLDLYIERIKVLVKTLPYIALVTKPGITMKDVGIPTDSKNKKIFDLQSTSTESYIETTVEFQKQLMPYADTSNIIAAILFYEQTLKSLRAFDELK